MLLHTPDQIVGFILYVVVGACAIACFQAMRATRRRVEETAARLQIDQAELEREVRERRAAEESLRSSDERFRRLVDSNIIGIMITDADGRITHANDELLRTLGYKRDEVLALGRPTVPDLTPPARPAPAGARGRRRTRRAATRSRGFVHAVREDVLAKGPHVARAGADRR